MSVLRQLAKAAGLDPEWTSWTGATATSSNETLLAALQAMQQDLGVQLNSDDDARGALADLEREKWNEIVPPVVVGWNGTIVVPFAVPASSDGEWEIEVTTEAGRHIKAHGRLFELPADSHQWPAGQVHCIRRATVWLDPTGRGHELGYHDVYWRCAGAQGHALGIAAPERAFGGPGSGKKRWGVFAPVYGLASPRSGEAGDLGTLRELFAAVRKRRGSYVATLPILAAFLDEPCAISPYSPASRLYWNELYLDLHQLAAELGMTAPTAPPIVPDTLIDFRSQYRWRRHALDPMAERLLVTRGPEIDAWAKATGSYDYAAFRAFGETTRTSWRKWPAMLREEPPVISTREDAIRLGADAARLDTHVVAQWAMQRQLEELARDPHVQLYLDLPVGVSCDAYEVWRWRHLFMTPLAAGAPPDPLFLGGQNWGLPPLSPIAVRRDHYRYVRRCIQHHMRVAGMLRVDHVMGLFRLYVVPEGRPATDGVYVRYQPEEMLAVLALESVRAKCALVGEDLGTVPEGVRPAMTRHGMFRLHVGQWSMPSKVGDHPGHAPAESIASLNTHDTPTFAGWWRGADIDDKLDLKLIDETQEAKERGERGDQRAALLAFAKADIASDHLTEVERAMVAVTTDLALGHAEVVLVALDDLALETTPHNVPGTTTERPNWQRRVQQWASALDEKAGAPPATATIAAVSAARQS